MVQSSAENILFKYLLIPQFPGNYSNETRKRVVRFSWKFSTEYQDLAPIDRHESMLYYIPSYV